MTRPMPGPPPTHALEGDPPMSDHYETTHPDADACAHAGVGKACRPCREVLDNLHRISLRHTRAGRALMAEGWKACADVAGDMAVHGLIPAHDLAAHPNPYKEIPND